VEPC